MNIKFSSRRQSGFTLIEMMIAMGVGSLLLLVMASFSVWSSRSFAAMTNYVDLDSYSRNALDTMTRDIRQAGSLDFFSPTNLTFIERDGQPLEFRYDPAKGTLTRVKHGFPSCLLTNCDTLKFNIFARNTTNETYDQFPRSENDAKTTKVVQLDWTCSRTILGSKINTESVQTAKIVIRNK